MNPSSPALLELKKNLRSFIVDTFLFGDAGNLTDETSFLSQGIVDSTGVLELVAHLEQTYRVQMKDDELVPENLDSINALAAFLTRKRQGSAA